MSKFVIGMADSEEDIASAISTNLIGKHIRDIQDMFLSGKHDAFVIFYADSTASINLRLWQEREPPFRHSSVIARIAFSMGIAEKVVDVVKKDFGIKKS